MGCKLTVFDDSKGNKIVAITCGVKESVCYKCGEPATKLCDCPTGEHTSCDKPMCINCANSIGEDNDVCDEHFNEKDIESAKYNRLEIEKNGQEIEKKYICPVCKNEKHSINANYCTICGNKITKG